MTITIGTRLGRYEIRSKLGEGGMGVVYRAVDTELDRSVAIKILPASLASDQQRLQRFTQEAKAASALNHPHILTIYEVGSLGDSRYIVTEFIDGDTLRQRVRAGMKLSDTLEVAIETTSALAAAHAAGIIHRDIKPENIMVRRDGYVKVLDFGLAKLADSAGLTTDTEAPTKTMVNTGAGTVMGTANYMSPEQAKGTAVDTRTDLWSVGAVLYEMITGHLPFAGETPTETISLILQKEPPPLTRYSHDVPDELERIVTKALTKDRDERYQTAKDLLIDLRNLKRKLEVDAEIDRTVPPELRASASTSSGQTLLPTASGIAVATAGASAVQAPSSAEYIASGIKHHKLAAAVALIVLVAFVVGILVYLSRRTVASIDSIAVLPFENQNNPDVDWLSDGVTETIINSLTQLTNLKVIARSSVFRYKGKQTDPLAAGKELGVRSVLTGRLTQVGDDVVVSVELVDVRDNKQIWGEQYRRKVSDLLTVQREIAQEITNNLRLRLSPAEQGQMMKNYAVNADAYQLYLKGRFYWNKRTRAGIEKSIEYFNQAIEHDPNYALAYAGLADSWFTMGWYRWAPATDTYPKSTAAAMKALQLDPQSAEAHSALAMNKAYYERDWAGAESEFKLSLQLNPKYPSAHHRYSLFLPIFGRMDEAVAAARKAQELDPLSLIINENLGDILMLAGRYDEAERQLLKTLELDPNFAVAHHTLARLYEAKGLYEKSIEEDWYGSSPEELARVKQIYAKSGMPGVWRDEIEGLLEQAKQGNVRSFTIAGFYARLGEKDKAFEWLDKALDERQIQITYLVDRRFDNIRSDPRYSEILKRMGLQK